MISFRIFKIMSIFTYCIRVYAVAPKSKYVSQIDSLLPFIAPERNIVYMEIIMLQHKVQNESSLVYICSLQ